MTTEEAPSVAAIADLQQRMSGLEQAVEQVHDSVTELLEMVKSVVADRGHLAVPERPKEVKGGCCNSSQLPTLP